MNPALATLDKTALGLNRQMTRWTWYYAATLWCLLSAWVGVVAMALVGIAGIEVARLIWRRIPPQPTSYVDPAPARWQAPIAALRWYLLIRNIAGLASFALIFTVVIVILAVAARPNRLGIGNLVVVIVIGLWLATRRLWFPRLDKAVNKIHLADEPTQPTLPAKLSITADGIDITVPPQLNLIRTAQPTWTWHVAFSEINEMRVLAETEAPTYAVGMLEYDPTLAIRANIDLARYANGQIARPAIYIGGMGQSLLVRGPDLLYLLGVDGGSGPTAAAAWRGWRAAHAVVQPT